MADSIRPVRGMNDVLPEARSAWAAVDVAAEEIFEAYGYRRIRIPAMERTELFSRSIGETTDIVQKEMYTFEDRNGDSLTLRPEGTASCVRAGLLTSEPLDLPAPRRNTQKRPVLGPPSRTAPQKTLGLSTCHFTWLSLELLLTAFFRLSALLLFFFFLLSLLFF